MTYYTYILTNHSKTVLYTGVTNDLIKRLYQHRFHDDKNSFTYKYNCYKLVYYEGTNSVEAAIVREKQIKGWTRAKKNELIEETNPDWEDLAYKLELR